MMINKKSILFRWIVSYLLLLIFILSFLVIAYKTIKIEITNEIKYANELQVDMVLKTLEPDFDDLKLAYSNLMTNIELNNLLNGNLNKKSELSKNIKSVCNNISSIVFSKKNIDEVLVYLCDNDMILSAHGYTDSLTTYEAIWGINSYETLNNLIHSGEYGRYVIFESEGKDKIKHKYIGYLQTIPINVKDNNPKAVVLTTIDSEKLNKKINEIVKDESEVTVADGSDNILLQTNRDIDRRSSISFSRKGGSGINYSIATPPQIYWSRLNHLKKVAWIMVAIIVIGGIAISIILARRNYAPIRKLLKNVNAGKPRDAKVDEYTYINELIADVITKLEEGKKLSEKRENQLEEYCIEKIAKGETEYLNGEFIDKFQKKLISYNFMVAFFNIENILDFLKGEANMREEEKNDMAKFVIRNVVAELIENEKCRSYFFENGIYTAVIINLPAEEDEGLPRRLRKNLENGFVVIYENFEITINGALSTTHAGINAIVNCCKECYDILGYMDMTGEDGIKMYDEIDIRNGYNYTIEQDIELAESIKNASYERAVYVINEIFINNTERSKITKEAVGYLVVNIVGTLMQIETDNTELLTFLGRVEDMLKRMTVNEIKERLLQIIKTMCENKGEEVKKCDIGIDGKVMELISENYADVNLNVQMIGEKLDRSPYYVSKLFKEITGIGVADYIRKYRINKAKDLIKTTNMKMDDIAKSVGISDARCFNGIFKRVEGISPSKYRDMVK